MLGRMREGGGNEEGCRVGFNFSLQAGQEIVPSLMPSSMGFNTLPSLAQQIGREKAERPNPSKGGGNIVTCWDATTRMI